MKRRNFLLTSLLAAPLGSFAKFKNYTRVKKGILVRAGEERFKETFPIGLKVSSQDTDGDLSVLVSKAQILLDKEGKPLHVGPPLHFHLYQDEIFFILEGEFLFQVGDDKFNLKPGDTLFGPRQVPHAFVNTSDTQGSVMTIFQPSGKMEDFFRKLR
ncbi:MAG: cupin domain-containing protein, partial [Ginsengibacter sp.]